jgi:hypothetical protein
MTRVVAAKKVIKFDPKTFLSTINGDRKIEPFPNEAHNLCPGRFV